MLILEALFALLRKSLGNIVRAIFGWSYPFPVEASAIVSECATRTAALQCMSADGQKIERRTGSQE